MAKPKKPAPGGVYLLLADEVVGDAAAARAKLVEAKGLGVAVPFAEVLSLLQLEALERIAASLDLIELHLGLEGE